MRRGTQASVVALMLLGAGTARGEEVTINAKPLPLGFQAASGVWASGTGRARVMLYKTPPTRTTCTFDSILGQRSVTVEWDPLRPGSLVREVALAKGTEYRFSCQSEPARHALDANVNFAWDYRGLEPVACCTQKKEIKFADCTEFHPANAPCREGVLGEITDVALPSIKLLEKMDAPSSDGQQMKIVAPLGALGGPSARAFGSVSEEALNELFKVIAEVAVEKVKSRAFRVVQGQVKKLVCTELTLPGTTAVLLPRTCEAITHVRLEELAGVGQQILDALARDFIKAALDELVRKVFPPKINGKLSGFESVLNAITDAVADLVSNKPERFTGAGQRLLVALQRVKWETIAGAAPEASQAVRVVFAAIAEVHRSGKIDASAIREMLERPEDFFADPAGGGDLTKLKEFLAKHHELPALIASAARVLSPPSETTEAAQLRASAGVALDLFALVAGAVMESTKKGSSAELNEQLRLARDLLDAAVQQDLARIVTASATLLTKLLSELGDPERAAALGRVTQLAGAVGAYLSTYPSGQKPSDAELKARHEARKAALSSLIDAQLARSNRLGDTIVSVGGTIGMMVGSSSLQAKSAGMSTQVQPSLAVALALDHHFQLSQPFGLHVEFSPVNLGSYLTWRNDTFADSAASDGSAASKGSGVVTPSAADVLSPSATLGITYLWKDADLILLTGFTGGYSFKAGNDASVPNRATYLGVTVGVYLPFFDFN